MKDEPCQQWKPGQISGELFIVHLLLFHGLVFLVLFSFESLAVLIFHNNPSLVPWYELLKPFPLLSAALSSALLPWWSAIDTVGFIVKVYFVCEVLINKNNNSNLKTADSNVLLFSDATVQYSKCV